MHRGKPTCQRCRQLGVQCEGYGIRLHWVRCNPESPGDSLPDDGLEDQQQTPAGRASRSSLAGLVVAHAQRLASPEIDNVLERIDDWRHQEALELSIGPFSVFAINPPILFPENPEGPGATELDHLSPRPSQVSLQRAESCIDQSPNNSGIHDEISTNVRLCVPTTDDAEGLATRPGYRRRADGDRTHQVDGPNANQLHAHHIVSATDSSLRQIRSHDETPAEDSCGPARHLDTLTVPSKQKRLIHHWIVFTSRKLVLLDEPQNPCRTLMLPMALQGLVLASNNSNADVAIFHAICASAAYNLYELGGREQDRVLALNHDQEAIINLRHNLAETDAHRAPSVAMAIMACIAVEAISGTTQRWRTHVTGGLAYLARLFSQGVNKELLSAFRHHMVKMAILCDFVVHADLKSFLHEENAMAVDLEFTFPYYGVSRSFLRRQDLINTLVASSNQSIQSNEEADVFELQMYLDFPSIPPPGLACTKNEIHGLVVHHASKAFYYAQLVYYQRSLRGASLSQVQDLVDLGVAELESIERYAASGELGCVMLWPALILGSESATSCTQTRVSSWFQSQRRLGFRNLVVLEELIKAVWASRLDGGAYCQDIGWKKLTSLSPAQFDVFRL